MPPLWQSSLVHRCWFSKLCHGRFLKSEATRVQAVLFTLQKWLKTALDEFYSTQFRTGARVALWSSYVFVNAAAAVASLVG